MGSEHPLPAPVEWDAIVAAIRRREAVAAAEAKEAENLLKTEHIAVRECLGVFNAVHRLTDYDGNPMLVWGRYRGRDGATVSACVIGRRVVETGIRHGNTEALLTLEVIGHTDGQFALRLDDDWLSFDQAKSAVAAIVSHYCPDVV